MITVLSTDEYQAQEYDAVLLRERTVVCIALADGEGSDDRLRVIPLEKINHIDAAPETMLAGRDIPETFHGGGECGFVELEKFPDLQAHLEEVEREIV